MCYPSADTKVIDPVEAHIQLMAKQMRDDNEVLKSWIKDVKDVPRCCVCGKPIENVSIQRMMRAFLWDSRECFTKKPKKIKALEEAYGLDIVDVLKITTRRYQNIEAQCNALNISIPYLYIIIRKYCNPDYIEFFAENAIGKRRETYLRKKHSRKSLQYPPRD